MMKLALRFARGLVEGGEAGVNQVASAVYDTPVHRYITAKLKSIDLVGNLCINDLVMIKKKPKEMYSLLMNCSKFLF